LRRAPTPHATRRLGKLTPSLHAASARTSALRTALSAQEEPAASRARARARGSMTGSLVRAMRSQAVSAPPPLLDPLFQKSTQPASAA